MNALTEVPTGPRVHYADKDGTPICSDLWFAKAPLVSTQGGKVTCKHCRRVARICDPLDDHDHTKCY
jgi:hypothetical protein